SILTGIAVAGTLTTGYLAWEAGRKSKDFIFPGDVRTTWQNELKLTWRLYIPTAVAAVTTLTCIVGAQRIADRKNAALAAAYSLAETTFREYRTKVVETIGEKKDEKIMAEVVTDRVRNNPPSGEVLMLADGEVTCYETYTGRYFKSNPERIRQTVNKFNQELVNGFGYASMNEFWEEIGLAWVQSGEEVGYNSDELLDVVFTSVLDPNNKPCLAIGYSTLPKENYHRRY